METMDPSRVFNWTCLQYRNFPANKTYERRRRTLQTGEVVVHKHNICITSRLVYNIKKESINMVHEENEKQ